jgi:hypothetical protein
VVHHANLVSHDSLLQTNLFRHDALLSQNLRSL